MNRDFLFRTFSVILILASLLWGTSRADPVQCTVGLTGTYSTIQTALDGCNGGQGSIQLILNGTFFENLVFPLALTNVTFTSEEFLNNNATAWPFESNLTAFIRGAQHQVLNTEMALYFQGIGLDGQGKDLPLFMDPLINNNLTLDRSLVENFSGNITIKGEACHRAVSLTVINSRFLSIWGSALYFEAMEDIDVESNIFDKCGGYNNFSCAYVKPSFVSQGVFIFSNNSHWLLIDALPPSCMFLGDRNGMTRCNNGTLQCYNVQDTELLRPNCEKEEMEYIDENTNLTSTVMDYPLHCRIYRPCECQNLLFKNITSQADVVLPIGDIFFYTGLRLNCTVENGTETINSTDLVYIMSLAGQTGVGTSPPLSDSSIGYSLSPGVYLSGSINNTIANCTCLQRNKSMTLEDAGLECKYGLGNATYTDTGDPIPLTCSNGTVKNCSVDFLRCFPLSDTMLQILGIQNSTDGGYHSYSCVNSTNIVNFTDVGSGDTYSNCTTNTTLDGIPAGTPTFILDNRYICIGYYPENTTFQILVDDISDTERESICNTSSLFTNMSCPEPSSNITEIYEITTCDNCTQNSTINGTMVLVMACSPWKCPANYTIDCNYEYFDETQNMTVSDFFHYIYNYTVFNGIPITNTTTTFQNGTDLCPAFTAVANTTSFENTICSAQGATPGYVTTANDTSLCGTVDINNNTLCCYNSTTFINGTDGCDILICVIPDVTLESINATLIPARPYNETAPCGVNYTCTADLNVTSCSCTLEYVLYCLTPYIPGNESAAFYWDNIRNETSFMDVTSNKCQQLPGGLLLDRTTEYVVYNHSTELPDRSTENARLREIVKQSPQLTGIVHDTQYGLFGEEKNIASYRFYCDGGCPLDYTKVSDFKCIVDASTPLPQVNRTYQTIQLAIDDDCDTILVNNFENFYTDQIIFKNKVKLLASFDQACVLNYGHEIHVSNLELRGMCFLHPGDESVELFDLKEDMENFIITNCYMDGGAVKGAGVIQLGEDKWIDNLYVNHTYFEYFNYATFILWRITNVWFSHNLFYSMSGRTVDIVYNGVFRYHDNACVNCRGVSNSGGNTMVRFMGRSANFFWLFGGDDAEACSKEAEKAFGHECAMYNNVQTTDATDDDFNDVCYTLVGGQITYDKIYDNFCMKAQIGFQLRGLNNLTVQTVQLLLRANAGIRPSNFLTTGNPKKSFDWVYDVYLTSETFLFFVPYRTLACNWPCGYVDFPVCTVNPNYNVGYVNRGNFSLTPYGLQNITNYAFGLFHNASQALAYCDITRINNVTGGLERPVYFVGDRGGIMFRDSFDITKPGFSFYGALLQNESGVNPCCFPRSRIFGDGYRILADNFTSCNMSYQLDDLFIDYNRDVFSTNPRLVPVYNLNFTNNTFDGGNLPAFSYNRILKVQGGFDSVIYEAQNTPKGGRRKPYLSQLKNISIVMSQNTFQNFSSFERTLFDVTSGETYNTTIFEFPFRDPIYIECLNEGTNTYCVVKVDNNTFYDVDRRAVDIRYADNISFVGNNLVRVGGRSPGNSAGVYIQGSRKRPSHAVISDNNMTQTKSIESDKTVSKTNPGYYASFVIRGFDNGTLCVYNNNISGGAIGIRFAGMQYDALLSCINATDDPPMFYDLQDNLRRIWFYNKNATGYIHWLVYGEVYQDFPQTWIPCDDGCPPGPPSACNVSLTDPAYVVTHPWYVFISFSLLSSFVLFSGDARSRSRSFCALDSCDTSL